MFGTDLCLSYRSGAPAREPRVEGRSGRSATDPSLKDVTLRDPLRVGYVRYHAHNHVRTQGQMHVHLHNV